MCVKTPRIESSSHCPAVFIDNAAFLYEKITYDGFDRIAEHKKLEDDGNTSTTTRYTYDPLDRTASRTEKARTSNEKTTTFQYLGLTDDVLQVFLLYRTHEWHY